jgi:hypothetical protein
VKQSRKTTPKLLKKSAKFVKLTHLSNSSYSRDVRPPWRIRNDFVLT